MEINYMTIVFTWINIALIIAILIGIYKGMKGLKSFMNRNKQMDKKLDIILSELGKNEK